MAPIFKNRPVQGSGADASAGYHGYWITDFTQIDPHFGTNAELEAFVDAAHARGIKVFFDIITNHTADVIDYAEGTHAYRNKATYPYVDADGNEFDDRDYAGTDTFPAMNLDGFPYDPVFPTAADATVKAPAWLNDRDDVPQPRRLDVRRRELRVRRLLRARRPVHRAARGRRRDDRHLQDVGDRRRHRRLPDRHGQARQHRVLAEVQPGPPGARRDAGQRRLLHVRRGVRRESRLHVALHDRGHAAGHARLRVPGACHQLRRLLRPDRRAARPLRRRRLLHRRGFERRTACRRSSATTTSAGSGGSSPRPMPAPTTPSCWPATSWPTR